MALYNKNEPIEGTTIFFSIISNLVMISFIVSSARAGSTDEGHNIINKKIIESLKHDEVCALYASDPPRSKVLRSRRQLCL